MPHHQGGNLSRVTMQDTLMERTAFYDILVFFKKNGEFMDNNTATVERETIGVGVTFGDNSKGSVFNFDKIKNAKGGSEALVLDNTIRLSKSNITIGHNVVERFQITRYNTESGANTRVRVGIEVDKANKAIKLYEDTEGFSATIRETGNAHLTMSTRLHQADMPRGDYVALSPSSNIFVLAV